MPTISLCMIVYNEENNIARALASAYKFVDEIIVVDTGSTDRTKAICEVFGARIFDYTWDDDFAAARNYSISKSSCDWILQLDADEELTVHDFTDLMQYLSNCSFDLVPVLMINFYGISPADVKRSHISGALRLIRNGKDALFSGRIHESIHIGSKSIDWEAETRRFIQILHYGYMEDIIAKKGNRNIVILLKEKNVDPDDPWLDYYIAVEYYRSGKFTEAYERVNAAIINFLKRNALPPAVVYKLKYDMLIVCSHFDTAYNSIEKAIQLYPDYVDLYFYKGILQYKRKEYKKAQETFSYCLILGETNMKYLILSGAGSFYALYYLGHCYEAQQQYEQAAEVYRKAAALKTYI